jgi:hypothetical protein
MFSNATLVTQQKVLLHLSLVNFLREKSILDEIGHV